MKKALTNMWAINILMAVINLYGLLYSIVKMAAYEQLCHSKNTFVYNSNTIINREISYIVWVVPIIYIFWPSTKSLFCCNRYNGTREGVNEEFEPTGLGNVPLRQSE
jgi:hypothetical protein